MEAAAHSITLDSDDNEGFAIFVQWLYTTGSSTSSDISDAFPVSDTSCLVKASCLRDKFEVVRFKTAVMDRLFAAIIAALSLSRNCALYAVKKLLG